MGHCILAWLNYIIGNVRVLDSRGGGLRQLNVTENARAPLNKKKMSGIFPEQ